MEAMRKIVRLGNGSDPDFELDRRYFRHHREPVAYEWAGGSPQFGDLFSPELEDLLGPRRLPDEPLLDHHRDIARSVQAMYEEAFFHLVLPLQRRSGLTTIALAGGCAMNSVANGKIRRVTPFQRVYVQSAAGDAGGAIGAAFAVWHQQGGGRSFVMDHAYWGPSFGQDAIAALLTGQRAQITEKSCSVEELADEAELCRRMAQAVADGTALLPAFRRARLAAIVLAQGTLPESVGLIPQPVPVRAMTGQLLRDQRASD
jgi:carbamoyltransferase